MSLQILEIQNKNGDTLRNSHFSGSSNVGVIFIPGFGRNSFEKKFHELTLVLEEHSICYLGFNPTGIVPSKGTFRETTFESLIEDLDNSVDQFISINNLKTIRLVAHSLGAAIALEFMKKYPTINKAILIAPALNQKDLNVFWAVKTLMEVKDPAQKVIFDNYKNYIEQIGKDVIDQYFNTDGRMTKTDYINSGYYKSVLDLDLLSEAMKYDKKILHIHGDSDKVVPISSFGSTLFSKAVIVKGGDHDLERPDMLRQWKDQAVDFLVG